MLDDHGALIGAGPSPHVAEAVHCRHLVIITQVDAMRARPTSRWHRTRNRLGSPAACCLQYAEHAAIKGAMTRSRSSTNGPWTVKHHTLSHVIFFFFLFFGYAETTGVERGIGGFYMQQAA
jgi:hypothetical protein